jgi:predicted DNA-binding protein
MKKKVFTRAVSVMLPEEMFGRIKAITDQENIAISDYVREAVKEKLEKTNSKKMED